jgi:hypothetical protein
LEILRNSEEDGSKATDCVKVQKITEVSRGGDSLDEARREERPRAPELEKEGSDREF